MNRMFGWSSGQVAVLYAGILAFGLVAAIGLGGDVAVMYVNWQQLQKAADAAALTGASYLPDNSSQAVAAAKTYLANNGSQTSELTGGTPTVSGNQSSITVSLARTVPYYFAQVLGMTNQLISVTATAGIEQNGPGARGLVPISMNWPGGYTGTGCNSSTPPYAVGTTYQMQCITGNGCSGGLTPGNWGALSLGANGAAQYVQNIELGFNGTISCGDTPSTKTGVMAEPTKQAINDRVNAGVAADPNIAAGVAPCSDATSCAAAMPSLQYDPRLVVAPMVDFNSAPKPGNTPVSVVQFALIWLLGTGGHGSNSTVNVVYLGTTPAPTTGSSTIVTFGTANPILQD